jgi:hypothetical protein
VGLDQIRLGEQRPWPRQVPDPPSAEAAAEHADGGGIARTVRAQKSVDFALLHGERDPIHHGLLPEYLGQSADVDDRTGLAHKAPPPALAQAHVHGLPGCMVRATSGEKPGIHQKHQLLRNPWLKMTGGAYSAVVDT